MTGITVVSEQFGPDGEIPRSCAHESVGGENRSPQLSWSGLPEGTLSVAITCWDPDAPTTVGFSHWVRFDIPPSTIELPEGAGSERGPWIDGFTDWGESRYGGMAPPEDDPSHQYQFTVYALGVESLSLDEQTTYAKFRFLAREHIRSTGTLVGRFHVKPS